MILRTGLKHWKWFDLDAGCKITRKDEETKVGPGSTLLAKIPEEYWEWIPER